MALRIDVTSEMVTADAMKKALSEGLEKSTNNNTSHILDEIEQLSSSFNSDVASGDFYEFIFIPEIGTHVLKNNELVELIKDHFGDSFEIFVAAYPEIHPESENYQKDIYWLNKKFEAGASRGITQYFYNSNSYLYFVEQCKKSGIEAPIIPGIMPITNYHNLVRFSENCGADIPRWIQKRLHQYGDDTESIKDFGLDVVTHLCEELLENNAPGLHFYTMNQADVNLTLCNRLGFSLANA